MMTTKKNNLDDDDDDAKQDKKESAGQTGHMRTGNTNRKDIILQSSPGLLRTVSDGKKTNVVVMTVARHWVRKTKCCGGRKRSERVVNGCGTSDSV